MAVACPHSADTKASFSIRRPFAQTHRWGAGRPDKRLMYLDYYRLRKEPFHITPDPEFLYLSTGHREALASIIYGIEQRKGFIAITGEVGVGKTTILRSYLEKVRHQGLRTIYILNAKLTFRELLRMIYYELDAPCERDEVFEMVNGLHHLLIEGYRQNENFVLLIDEAQNLPVETLENLRMLSNLETSKDKLIQIVLVGQPELVKLLNLAELRQLKQRIAIRSDIAPLSPRESLEYIKYRLKKAGGDIDRIFAKRAVSRIIKESKGIPRLLNVICDNALITGFGSQEKPVGHKIVKEVVADLKVQRKGIPSFRWGMALSLLVLAIGFYFSVPYVKEFMGRNKMEVPRETVPGTGVQDGKSGNTGLSGVSVGGETGGSQEEGPAQKANVKKEPEARVAPSTPSQREGGLAREPGDPPKQHPTVDASGDSLRANAPPERLPAAAPEVQIPVTSAPPVLVAEPRKNTSTPDRKTVRKIIKKGETLSELAREVYGTSGPQIIGLLKQHNPHIKDPDRIMVGDEVNFPAVDGAEHVR